jgi:hypothetical protein
MRSEKTIPMQIIWRAIENINNLFFKIFFDRVILKIWSPRESMQLIASIYTIISDKVIRWLGGSWSLILGINAMKPKTIVAIVPIFYAGLA